MRSAFKIETKMNVVCEVGFNSAPRKVLRMRASAVWAQNDINSHHGDDADDDRPLEQVLLLHNPMSYLVSSESMPATAVRAISRMDLSALRTRKLVSLTAVIVPITPPVVIILSPAFRSAICDCSCRCFFCCGLINKR